MARPPPDQEQNQEGADREGRDAEDQRLLRLQAKDASGEQPQAQREQGERCGDVDQGGRLLGEVRARDDIEDRRQRDVEPPGVDDHLVRIGQREDGLRQERPQAEEARLGRDEGEERARAEAGRVTGHSAAPVGHGQGARGQGERDGDRRPGPGVRHGGDKYAGRCGDGGRDPFAGERPGGEGQGAKGPGHRDVVADRVAEVAPRAHRRDVGEQQDHGRDQPRAGAAQARDEHSAQPDRGEEGQPSHPRHHRRPRPKDLEQQGVEWKQRQDPVVLGVAPGGQEAEAEPAHAAPQLHRHIDVGVQPPGGAGVLERDPGAEHQQSNAGQPGEPAQPGFRPGHRRGQAVADPCGVGGIQLVHVAPARLRPTGALIPLGSGAIIPQSLKQASQKLQSMRQRPPADASRAQVSAQSRTRLW